MVWRLCYIQNPHSSKFTKFTRRFLFGEGLFSPKCCIHSRFHLMLIFGWYSHPIYTAFACHLRALLLHFIFVLFWLFAFPCSACAVMNHIFVSARIMWWNRQRSIVSWSWTHDMCLTVKLWFCLEASHKKKPTLLISPTSILQNRLPKEVYAVHRAHSHTSANKRVEYAWLGVHVLVHRARVHLPKKDATFSSDVYTSTEILDERDVCVNQCKSYVLMDFFISLFHSISIHFFAVCEKRHQLRSIKRNLSNFVADSIVLNFVNISKLKWIQIGVEVNMST